MEYYCFKCSEPVASGSAFSPGRRDECSKCHSDLHVCRNCKHYDTAAYNSCREPQAERVVDKDRSNFCDYFAFREGKSLAGSNTGKTNPLADLERLFK